MMAEMYRAVGGNGGVGGPISGLGQPATMMMPDSGGIEVPVAEKLYIEKDPIIVEEEREGMGLGRILILAAAGYAAWTFFLKRR